MIRIAHVSDTHFGTEISRVTEALRQILASLQPDLLLVSGDITQRARRREFAAAKAFFDRLHIPASVFIPGNHDIPLYNLFARAFRPYGNFLGTFGPRTGIWRHQHATVIALDTTHPLRHSRGKLDRQQLSRLTAQARHEHNKDALLLAAVHQPLQTNWMQDRKEVLLNSREAAQALSSQGVDLVFSGHVHVPIITTTREGFPQLDRHFILAGAGTATSYRTRAGISNSFNLLTVGENHAEVDVDAFFFEEEEGCFMHKSLYRFTRTDDGWC